MKNKILIPSILWGIAAIFLTTCVFCTQSQTNDKSKLTVEPIDSTGIFVGEKSKAMIAQGKHEESLKAIDTAWEYIRSGNSYDDAGHYGEAARAYEKSYTTGGGAKAVSGFKLAEAYEKLGRYDDAISQLERMIQNHELSELGIQDAKEMISRLLAAKPPKDPTNPQTQ